MALTKVDERLGGFNEKDKLFLAAKLTSGWRQKFWFYIWPPCDQVCLFVLKYLNLVGPVAICNPCLARL